MTDPSNSKTRTVSSCPSFSFIWCDWSCIETQSFVNTVLDEDPPAIEKGVYLLDLFSDDTPRLAS